MRAPAVISNCAISETKTSSGLVSESKSSLNTNTVTNNLSNGTADAEDQLTRSDATFMNITALTNLNLTSLNSGQAQTSNHRGTVSLTPSERSSAAASSKASSRASAMVRRARQASKRAEMESRGILKE